MTNQLEKLKTYTTVVVDSGDFASISTFTPQDATTNPSLMYTAAQQSRYAPLIEEALFYGKKSMTPLSTTLDRLFLNFAREILKIIPGRVSVEIDSRLSYDAKKSQEKAEFFLSLLEKEGLDRERILIKLASTWEGILAAKELEKKKIHCNMTLLFCLPQASAAADAKVTLISPFVGRILDWYKKKEGKNYPPPMDPGVMFVTKVFHYYKKFAIPTQIMGASFRNKEEILELAGCDLLTISPKYLKELQESTDEVMCKLNPLLSLSMPLEKLALDHKKFLLLLHQDAMAKEKLQEGIDSFNKDLVLLENLIQAQL